MNIEFHTQPDDYIEIEQLMLMFHPDNSQERSAEEMTAIKASIAEEGFLGEFIVVNRWNNKIVSGHGRTTACWEIGYRGKLPVIYKEYTSEVAHRRAMLRANRARGHQNQSKETAEVLALVRAYGSRKTAMDLTYTPDYVAKIIATAQRQNEEMPITTRQEGESDNALVAQSANPSATPEPLGPPTQDLIGAWNPKWNKKRTCRFLSLRSWRMSVKDTELKIVKEWKSDVNDEIVLAVATEIASSLRQTLITFDHWVVTSAPRGHSKGERHFSTEIGKAVADELNCEYRRMFADRERKGSSYPTKYAENDDIQLLEGEPSSDLVILIDDIASTGSTIEKCMSLLRDATVIPLAWMYEDARG